MFFLPLGLYHLKTTNNLILYNAHVHLKFSQISVLIFPTCVFFNKSAIKPLKHFSRFTNNKSRCNKKTEKCLIKKLL